MLGLEDDFKGCRACAEKDTMIHTVAADTRMASFHFLVCFILQAKFRKICYFPNGYLFTYLGRIGR